MSADLLSRMAQWFDWKVWRAAAERLTAAPGSRDATTGSSTRPNGCHYPRESASARDQQRPHPMAYICYLQVLASECH